MNSHAKKEVSTKNSSSLANLRNVVAGQADVAPRKVVSHEGFQKMAQTSSTSSNSGNTSTESDSNKHPVPGGVSTFSYLKARLFGSVADASTSLSSSARDLLQSRKGSELTKGSSPEPSFGGNAGAQRNDTSNINDSAQALGSAPTIAGNPPTSNANINANLATATTTTTTNTTTTTTTTTSATATAVSPGDPPLSPMGAQHSSSANRLFSRTLPSRRQPQPELLQPTLSKQVKPVSSTDLFPPPSSDSATLTYTMSPSNLTVPSPTSVTYRTHQSQSRISTASTLNAQKHLSTGSLIFLEGYLNKKVELHSGETGHGWKVYKVILKSSKLYFYKPLPTDERPRFQGPKDHNRYLSPNHAHRDQQNYRHHSQHSSSSGIISPRLSITNESGMVLSAFNFESSTRTLLFEGNAKSLSQGAQAFAPPVTKYVYGECFTEIDRLTMQFKKHVALLLFEDSVVICKRKWMRYTSTKVKDAIKFSSNSHEKGDVQESVSGKRQASMSGISNKSGDSRGSGEGDQRNSGRNHFDLQPEKQRGYFTKWKHEATYPLSQVEALDMASPVPSSSATFYPFAAPATSAVGNFSYPGKNSFDSDTSSIYTTTTTSTATPSHLNQTTSTLELVITSNIDGKEFTHRLLYLPPSQEVRHQWYSKFNKTKEIHQSNTRTTSKGRGSVESLVLKDTLSPRSISPNSAMTLHSPTSPKMYSDTGNFVLNTRKMDRARLFCRTTTHPELTLRTEESTGKSRLSGASINGLIHELVHGNVVKEELDLVSVFATTYTLFTNVSHVTKEIRRCVDLESPNFTDNSAGAMLHRLEKLIREMVLGINVRSVESGSLEEIKSFTEDILRDKLGSRSVNDILKSIDSVMHDQGEASETVLPEGSSQSTAKPSESSVDLSNVLITGLTPAVFLKLEPSYFSEQVLRYHLEQLQIAGDSSMLLRNPAFFMRHYPTSGKTRSTQSPLVFSMYSPHFLTVLITHHILIATQSVQSTSRRPKLLAQWIRTAQCSRALGDLAGFLAIAIGICSPGVVRLQETWKQVPLDFRLEVANTWVPLLIKMDMITEDLQELAISSFDLKPSLTTVIDLSLEGRRALVPCVSNIKQSIDQLDRVMPSFIQSTPVPLLNLEKLEHIHSILNKARKSLPVYISGADASLSFSENTHLQQYFDHLASISQTLHDQYHASELSNDAFESSLACEPHFNGQYLDYHYKNRKMTGSFIPLTFPEVAQEKRLFPLSLLLSLENTGNTYRKSSFDESHTFETGTSRASMSKQSSGNTSTITQGSVEWIDSSATHHGTAHLGLSGSSPYARPRKRTYSFPPARTASRTSEASGIQPMVNMINPHLDAVASGCLHNVEDSEANEVYIAMRDVAGIGYNMISIEGGNLVLKVREENLETLVKAVMQEEEERDFSIELKKPATNWNADIKQGSNRSSLSVICGPRPAMVKAGSLGALIHTVVMGFEDQSGKYMDEKGDMMSWTSRPLTLDHELFMKAFFATYRSFCTSSRLMEQLVTMFTFAQQSTAVRTSNVPSGLDLFSGPHSTSSETLRASTASRTAESRSSSAFDWRRIMTVQSNVLRALEYWLEVHISDFLDELTLKAKLSEALKLMAVQEKTQRQLVGEIHSGDAHALSAKLQEVTRFAVQQSMKPLQDMSLALGTLEAFFGQPPSIAPRLDDSWTSYQILDQLNTAAWAHFLSVREQDWYLLFEILESQSADPLGWYLSRPNVAPVDEEVLIEGIHTTLYSIRRNGAPGTHWNGERLMNSLPLCLQNICKLHHIIRVWVISQIASPSIGHDVRLDRVQKMLDIILQSRQIMSRFGEDLSKLPRSTSWKTQKRSNAGVPSLVEKAIVSALISPESRAFSRVWLELASGQKGSIETLEDVLSSYQEKQSLPEGAAMQETERELVPAVGWLIERMLETCCYVRDMSYESPQLVNFDKRQYVYDLVQVYARHQEQLRDANMSTTPLSSWLGLATGPSSNLTMKVVREAAQRESTNQRSGSTGQLAAAGNVSGRTSSRPAKVFSRLIALQHEKERRDQKEFEKLEKQIKDTQGRIQKAQQEQAKSLEKQIKLEQSRSRVKNQLLKSTLMRAMRPISLAITNSWSSATTTVSNATALGSAISGKVMGGAGASGGGSAVDALGVHQLQIQPRTTSLAGSIHSSASPRPVLVINLINSTCSVAYTYTKRDFVFKIVTEEGGQSLLQAQDYDEMLKWIKTLNEAAAEATAKRRTLLDSEEALKNALDTTIQVDEITATPENERKGRNSVFGVELRHLMNDGSIPLIVEKCIAEIEKRGLEEVGIYRVPGAVSSINKLRQSFNSGSQNVDLDSDEWKDINVVAGALKQFLRELPEAVMTSNLYESLIAASALEDYDERLLTMKDLIRSLPPPNYLLLKRVIEHLERVTDYEEVNHMYATNLAIVFGPTLLRPGGTSANSFMTSMKNLGHQQNIVRNMILQYHWLFDVEGEEDGAEEGEAEDEEEELGEFPEILEDSDDDDDDEDDRSAGGDQSGEFVGKGTRTEQTAKQVDSDDKVLVLTASQPIATRIDVKDTNKDGEKNLKSQRRKTVVFG